MFNFLMQFTNSGKISAATAEEQRACLEAVILTLCSDRHLTFVEQWEFQQLVKRIRWRINVKNEIPDIWEKARAALQDAEKQAAYLTNINANIFSKKVSKAIFLICEDIGYDSIYFLNRQLQRQLREAILSAPSQSSQHRAGIGT